MGMEFIGNVSTFAHRFCVVTVWRRSGIGESARLLTVFSLTLHHDGRSASARQRKVTLAVARSAHAVRICGRQKHVKGLFRLVTAVDGVTVHEDQQIARDHPARFSVAREGRIARRLPGTGLAQPDRLPSCRTSATGRQGRGCHSICTSDAASSSAIATTGASRKRGARIRNTL